MLTRSAAVIGTASTLVLAVSGVAWADNGWGGVDCGQSSYAGCQLGAGQGSQPGHAHSPQRPGSGEGNGGAPSSNPPPPQGDQILDPPNLADCRYVRSDYQPPANGPTPAAFHPPSGGVAPVVTPIIARAASTAVFGQQPPPGPGQSGAWYVYRCTGPGWRDALYRPPVWIPDGPAQEPSPAELAQQAYNQLRLPSPQIHANPAGMQLVRLPTWLWLDRTSWHPQTATASVPGVSVTATATPQSVTWSLGDGSTVTCPGAGTPFPPSGNPTAPSPDCGHTYAQSSQGNPGQTFAVAATVHWTVTWSGPGGGGTFPDLTTTANAAFTVAESQALNHS